MHVPVPLPQLLHLAQRHPHGDEAGVVEKEELVGGVGIQGDDGDLPLLRRGVGQVRGSQAVPVALLVLLKERVAEGGGWKARQEGGESMSE